MSDKPKLSFLGSLPLRMPVSVVGGSLLMLALLPVWWLINIQMEPAATRYYLLTYIGTGIQRRLNIGGMAESPRAYMVMMRGSGESAVVLLGDFREGRDGAHRVSLSATPSRLHAVLDEHVFHGWTFRGVAPFAVLAAVSLILPLGGGIADRRRRRDSNWGVHIRGSKVVHWREAQREMLKGGAKPGLVIPLGGRGEEFPLTVEMMTRHLAIHGATGNGKSSVIWSILEQARARGYVCVVNDPKGEFSGELYRPGVDFIIDPSHDECACWASETECADEAQGAAWAKAFFPDVPGQHEFFVKYARGMLAFLLSQYSVFKQQGSAASCENLGGWFSAPDAELAPRLRGTEYAMAANRDSKDQSQGLYGSLGLVAKSFRLMPRASEGRRVFSVRGWSERRRTGEDPGWVFFTTTRMTAEASRPIQSAILDMLLLSTQDEAVHTAANAQMALFVLDEVVTSFQRLPQLEFGMTNLRSSGGMLILGIHDHAQLKASYGENGAVTVMSQAKTNILFQTGDPSAAKYCEQLVGHCEVLRTSENFPAHALSRHRRSRSFTSSVADIALFTAAEIQAWPPFFGYVVQLGKAVELRTTRRTPGTVRPRVDRIVPAFVQPPEVPAPDTGAAPNSVASIAPLDQVAPVNDERPKPAVATPLNRVRRRNPLAPGAGAQINLLSEEDVKKWLTT